MQTENSLRPCYIADTFSKGKPLYGLQQESVACPKLCQHMLNSAIISLLNKDFFIRTLDSGLKTFVNNGLKSTFPMSFDQLLDGKHKHCSVHKYISLHSMNYVFQHQIVKISDKL